MLWWVVISPYMQNGLVEMYEYGLGFCILRTLVHTKPNEKDYDDKYIMGVYKIEKKKMSNGFAHKQWNNENI